MADDTSPLMGLVRKLGSRKQLDEDDLSAILSLPYSLRTFEPASYIVREGEPPRKRCSFVISGYAFRQKLTVQGARQIVSLHMAGDLLDLQHLFLKKADHNVQALTRVESAEIEREALRALALERPAIGEAMWIDALIDASRYKSTRSNISSLTGICLSE